MSNSDYEPISCSFHDVLEHHASRGDVVLVAYETKEGEKKGSFWLLDVFARDGADWVRMLSLGEDKTKAFDIRLDRLLSVNGKELPRYC